MNAQRPAGHVPKEREAKHQQANSDVRGIRPSLTKNWRHAGFPLLIRTPEVLGYRALAVDRSTACTPD